MKKLFEWLGAWSAMKNRGNPIRDGFTPYVDEACNRKYNLLFCDKPEVFRREFGPTPVAPWNMALAKQPSIGELRELAENRGNESRLRLLACHRLRTMRQTVGERQLLGVVVEVGSEEGLEVVAAYRDGRVHCIDNREIAVAVEAVQEKLSASVRALMNAAQAAVDRIGPWLRPRIAPPTAGMVRMSFLATDGLYFGQGLLDLMRGDELACPIILASESLRAAIASSAARE